MYFNNFKKFLGWIIEYIDEKIKNVFVYCCIFVIFIEVCLGLMIIWLFDIVRVCLLFIGIGLDSSWFKLIKFFLIIFCFIDFEIFVFKLL